MNSDSLPRTSFFDDDDLNLTFQFQHPETRHQRYLNSPSILSNILLRKPMNGGLLEQGFYVLHSRVLAFYKISPVGQPDAILDLGHSRLQIMPASLTTSYYGFSVTRNGVKHEFYSADQKTVENWTNALKSVCVLMTFHDEYKAVKMIGKGSFAKVYLVESKTNGKTFAVKAFTKESVVAANKANAKPSMMNEIDIMRVLDHDNVIKLYEVYETEKSIYLVLELIQGKSLQELLKKGGFKDNEPRMINIMSSLLEALAYLSSKGVMHRDLKPDNILVDKCDKIKIVDFGLATFIDVPEYIFKKCGTPGYIAPEVFKFDQKNPLTAYDGRCDVFSTGCILYFMIFGIPFFDGPNASEILKINRRFTIEFQALNNVKAETTNPHSKVSHNALSMLLQLLEFDQKMRPTASQAVGHPFIYSAVHQKLTGYYDFYPSGGASPLIYDKRGSFAQEQFLSQLKSGTLASATSPVRYTEKDSLYLDIGRPEMTGRIDTLTSGSANNSMLLMSRGVSNNDSSPLSASAFKNSGQKSFRNYPSGDNQSFMKSPLVRTSQAGEMRDPKDGMLLRLEEVKNEKRHSEFVIGKNDVYQGVNTNYTYYPQEYEDSSFRNNGQANQQLKYGEVPLHRLSILDPTKGL